MEESPRKQKSTSKVIDSLHSQIDELKDELEVLRSSCGDYKKKSSILASKNDSLVDQLANCKHENDMVNALLKRKERRITDLEAEFDDLSSESESTKQAMKNYKIRCENLQASSASSTAEHERLKISYDALLASQGEYKRHYQAEVTKVSSQLDAYKSDSSRALADLSSKLERNDKDVDALLEGLNSKRVSMDNVLVDRNKSILSLLSLLAKVAKTHGEECQSLLQDNVQIINTFREKVPEVSGKVPERTVATIDIDKLLQESANTLADNFAELDVKASGDIPRQSSRSAPQSGRRRNRNSLRISPDTSLSDVPSQEVLPKQRGNSKGQSSRGSENGTSGTHRQSQKRNHSNGQTHNQSQRSNSGGRQPSSGSQTNKQRSSMHPRSGSANQNLHRTTSHGGQSKSSKRRSFHGGSSTFNSGVGERKADEAGQHS